MKKWTNEEVSYLKDNFQSMSCEKIAKNLKKTIYAVQHKFNKLKLQRISNIPDRFKIGTPFGRLTVSSNPIPIKSSENKQKWKVECECSCNKNKKLYSTFLLEKGTTKSCGCLRSELSSIRCKHLNKKYSSPKIRKHPLYNWWNRQDINLFCEEWKNYENFYNDIILSWSENKKILRLDIDIPFNKTNIKFENYIPTKSGQEIELQNWLNKFGFNFQTNKLILNGKHIDLYDEELKFGIEYCGLYWHTEDKPGEKNRQYHLNKYILCKKQNIHLLTIFSDEWTTRVKQIKSYIKAKLNIFIKIIYARKCVVKEIDQESGNNFINIYHIQGKKSSLKYFGLFNIDELIGVMSVGMHHRDNKKLILDRLVFKDGYRIIGGANKLFKTIKDWSKNNNYTNIITWSDNRWSNGNVYEKMNFLLDKILDPDYSYVNMSAPFKRKSKQSCKKKTIGCPNGLTEKEYMNKLGYSRIWDCGKIRWKYEL